MKNLLKFSLILLLSTYLISCSNDNQDVIDEPQGDTLSVSLKSNLTKYAKTEASRGQADDYLEDNYDGECVVINYPYTILHGVDYNDPNETVINSDEELEAFFETIYNDNDNDNEFEIFFGFKFPLTVTLQDGSQQTVEDYAALEELQFECIIDGDDGDDDGDDDGEEYEECFTLNFPLTVIDLEGNSQVVNSEQELYAQEGFVGFEYPITVTLTDGTEQTINGDDDFDDLYNDCYDIDDCDDCVEENCFEIIFPLNFVKEDGTVVTVNDENEFIDFIEDLGEDEFFTLTYPINVELEDGTEQAINSDEEFEALLSDCYDS